MIGEILSKKVGQHAGVKFLASLHTKTIFYNLGSRSNLKQNSSQNQLTTLQSMMNAKLSHQRFWYCYENGLIRYPTMYVWVSSWLPFTVVYPMLTEFVTHHRLEGCELLVLATFCNIFCHLWSSQHLLVAKSFQCREQLTGTTNEGMNFSASFY